MMFPSVWSSLLMVNRQALGTLVSLLMVILHSTGAVRAMFHCIQQPGRPWGGLGEHGALHRSPPRPPAWLLLTFSRLRREGRTRKPEERSSRRLTLPPRRSCGAQSATSARTSGGGAPCRAGGLRARVLQRLRTRRGAELHLYCHTRGTAPPPFPPSPSLSPHPSPLHHVCSSSRAGGSWRWQRSRSCSASKSRRSSRGSRGPGVGEHGAVRPSGAGSGPQAQRFWWGRCAGGPSLCSPFCLYLHRSLEGRSEVPPPPSAASTFPCGEEGRLAVGQRARRRPLPLLGSNLRGCCRPWRCWKRRCASTSGCSGSLQSCRVMLCRVLPHPGPVGQRG